MLMIIVFMFSAALFTNTVEKESLSTKSQETEEVSCSYTSQYTWYRMQTRQVFTMAGTVTEVTYVIDKVCTNCYSLSANGTTVTTTCVNY